MTKNDGTESLFYSVSEVAKVLGVSSQFVRNLVSEGKLNGVMRMGKHIKIAKKAFDKQLSEGMESGYLYDDKEDSD